MVRNRVAIKVRCDEDVTTSQSAIGTCKAPVSENKVGEPVVLWVARPTRSQKNSISIPGCPESRPFSSPHSHYSV